MAVSSARLAPLGCFRALVKRVASANPSPSIFQSEFLPNDGTIAESLKPDTQRARSVLLAAGEPTGQLPTLEERRANYEMVAGSKYGTAAALLAGV